MSIQDDLCDLCGAYVEPTGKTSARASLATGRTWCGTCNPEIKAAISIWIYNSDSRHPITKEQKFIMERTAPIRRPSWDDYYLGIAKAVSTRGDCVRRQHGAVIVKNHSIISTGYNGSPPGSDKSCGATGDCPRNLDPYSKHGEGSYDLCWATHAESNALLRAPWEGLKGATIYITGPACPGCAKLIKSAGIERVVTL
jgi:dCMP deaminase